MSSKYYYNPSRLKDLKRTRKILFIVLLFSSAIFLSYALYFFLPYYQTHKLSRETYRGSGVTVVTKNCTITSDDLDNIKSSLGWSGEITYEQVVECTYYISLVDTQDPFIDEAYYDLLYKEKEEARKKELGVENLSYEQKHVVIQESVSEYNEKLYEEYNRVKQQFDLSGNIEGIEPNPKFSTFLTPNDNYIPDLWGLRHINAFQAWDIGYDSDPIVIAISDTGVDYNHPDLSDKVIAGYDFGDDDNDPIDTDSHGTHVAGITAAKCNNSIGVCGVCPSCKLIAVKVFNRNGTTDAVKGAKSIRYSADLGASVINMSWGGYVPAPVSALINAVDYGRSKGMVHVAAAGNCNRSHDSNEPTDLAPQCRNPGRSYPSDISGVIAVGAIDETGGKAFYSDYGDIIKLSAPGSQILSTVPGGSYRRFSGTSMSAPHVSGAIGLLRAYMKAKGQFSSTQAQSEILVGDTLQGNIGNSLDIYRALSVFSDLNDWAPTEIELNPDIQLAPDESVL